MRHGMAGRKFNRPMAARKALLTGLARALFLHGQIKTTLPKAKDLRSVAEKLITKAKTGTLAARREVLAVLQDNAVVQKLFNDIAPQSQQRQGGYTRVLKAGFRAGDAAPMAVISLTDRTVAVAAKAPKAKKAKAEVAAPAAE
mgnify:CR=1 FL=1